MLLTVIRQLEGYITFADGVFSERAILRLHCIDAVGEAGDAIAFLEGLCYFVADLEDFTGEVAADCGAIGWDAFDVLPIWLSVSALVKCFEARRTDL